MQNASWTKGSIQPFTTIVRLASIKLQTAHKLGSLFKFLSNATATRFGFLNIFFKLYNMFADFKLIWEIQQDMGSHVHLLLHAQQTNLSFSSASCYLKQNCFGRLGTFMVAKMIRKHFSCWTHCRNNSFHTYVLSRVLRRIWGQSESNRRSHYNWETLNIWLGLGI